MRQRRLRPPKRNSLYRFVWRLVDGAVRDAFTHHPEYLASGAHEKDVRNSIAKRVTGAITGSLERSRGG